MRTAGKTKRRRFSVDSSRIIDVHVESAPEVAVFDLIERAGFSAFT